MNKQSPSATTLSTLIFATFFTITIAITACGSGNNSQSADPNQAVDVESTNTTSTASTTSTGSTHSIPTPTPIANASPAGLDAEGYKTCVSTDSTHICIGLSIVSYLSNGVPTLTEAQAETLVDGMNTVWDQCNVGYQLENYTQVDPTTKGLSYNPDWESDAGTIRGDFASATQFVVIAVGSLSGSTIAVTEMPGGGPYGTLVEAAYATNPLTVGHELGHYQGLYHVSDTTNLMNPYIGTDTETLTSSQCASARSTDTANWQAMMRN